MFLILFKYVALWWTKKIFLKNKKSYQVLIRKLNRFYMIPDYYIRIRNLVPEMSTFPSDTGSFFLTSRNDSSRVGYLLGLLLYLLGNKFMLHSPIVCHPGTDCGSAESFMVV